MKKETILIFKWPNHPQSYSRYCSQQCPEFVNGLVDNCGVPTDGFIMATICEFTKDKNITIYSHDLRNEWKENKEYSPYVAFSDRPIKEQLTIPCGDLIYYLDIYYQDAKTPDLN